MSSWLFALFTCAIYVQIEAKQDTRIRSMLPDLLWNAKEDDNCRNTFFEENCYNDNESDAGDRMDYLVSMNEDEQQDSGVSKKITPNIFQAFKGLQKRRTAHPPSCCHMKNYAKDLGFHHYPRYLLTVVCENMGNDACKPVYYKVKVLTTRSPTENPETDPLGTQLPETLRTDWKLKIVSVQVGCYCS